MRKSMKGISVSLGLALAAATAVSLPALSAPIVLTAPGVSIIAIGNQIPNGQYDQLSVSALSRSVSGVGTYSFGNLNWLVGLNTNLNSQYTATGVLSEDITVNGVTDLVSLPFLATINAGGGLTDTVSFTTSTDFFGAYAVTFSAGKMSASNGGQAHESLVGKITSAPEMDPASAASFMALLAGALMVLRGGRCKATVAV